MQLNDLFNAQNIDPGSVLVMRHRPTAAQLNRVLPWLAAERPAVFNCYQQTQTPTVERAMLGLVGRGYLASFLGQRPGKATFVALYRIAGSRPMTRAEFRNIPENRELDSLGNFGFRDDDPRETIEFFDLVETDFRREWKGKLIVDWPPPERSWWRRSERNAMGVAAILEESAFARAMPEWDQINLSWAELKLMPTRWCDGLSHWRGIYFIYDASDGRGYVGSAGGEQNLLGRWLNYAASGHGGNALLRKRDPRNFRFSVLQLLAPTSTPEEVVRAENSWKQRLHTRAPFGLNEN